MAIRLGAVGYLNARPLTWALDRQPERWDVRYDVPSVCAALLHGGQVERLERFVRLPIVARKPQTYRMNKRLRDLIAEARNAWALIETNRDLAPAEIARRCHVHGCVSHPGRHQQPEVRQLLEEPSGERGALTHQHDDLHAAQLLDERGSVGDVLVVRA